MLFIRYLCGVILVIFTVIFLYLILKICCMRKVIFLLIVLLSFTILTSNSLKAQTTEVKTKTNASHKGKNAAIGAGVGAATGAVVSHKKGK